MTSAPASPPLRKIMFVVMTAHSQKRRSSGLWEPLDVADAVIRELGLNRADGASAGRFVTTWSADKGRYVTEWRADNWPCQ